MIPQRTDCLLSNLWFQPKLNSKTSEIWHPGPLPSQVSHKIDCHVTLHHLAGQKKSKQNWTLHEIQSWDAFWHFKVLLYSFKNGRVAMLTILNSSFRLPSWKRWETRDIEFSYLSLSFWSSDFVDGLMSWGPSSGAWASCSAPSPSSDSGPESCGSKLAGSSSKSKWRDFHNEKPIRFSHQCLCNGAFLYYCGHGLYVVNLCVQLI